MKLGVNGKVALVCGGSKGIGKEAALILAAEGCRVAIVARDRVEIDRTVAEIEASGGTAAGVSSDFNSEGGVLSAVESVRAIYGAPDIVVSQMNFTAHGRFLDVETEHFNRLFNALTVNVVRLAKAVVPSMRERGWGRFVHIGTVTAKEPDRTHPHVMQSTVQASIVTLMKSLADEFAGDGLTFNTVGPGWTKTPTLVHFAATQLKLQEHEIDNWLATAQAIPAQRAGTAEELGSVVAFLCSRQAGYLTGEWIAVDGGMHRAAF